MVATTKAELAAQVKRLQKSLDSATTKIATLGVEVSVSDTGIDIAREGCEAVFEEFRQVGSSSDRKAEGTGLGLALTRKFIELHGGTIWVTSELGKGSTFTFTLPVKPADAKGQDAPPS